jgi:hypothetical protein
MSDGGKGSKARPLGVEYDKYSSNWDTIFRKKLPKERDDAVAEDEAFKLLEERNKNVISDQKPD